MCWTIILYYIILYYIILYYIILYYIILYYIILYYIILYYIILYYIIIFHTSFYFRFLPSPNPRHQRQHSIVCKCRLSQVSLSTCTNLFRIPWLLHHKLFSFNSPSKGHLSELPVIHLLLFCAMDQQTHTIISQIITLLHVSTLSCLPQTACNQYLAKLHQYFVLWTNKCTQ